MTGAAASSGTAAGLGAAAITGAVAGAAGGAAGAASQGNDWKQAALKGAYSGAVSAGLFYEAGTLTQGYANGSIEKVAAHALAGGTASELTGGKFLNGAVSAGFAEGISTYTNGLQGWKQTAASTVSGAAGSWLAGGDAQQGALAGLAGDLYNRAMHPEETSAVDKLVAQGADRNTVWAVACNQTHCWSGDNLGLMSGHTQDEVSATLQTMTPDQYQATLAQLNQIAPDQFKLSTIDSIRDYLSDNNVGTRAAGTFQWLTAGVQAFGGLAMCITGSGCAAGGYLWTSAWDNANAGAYAMVNGQFTYTAGGQLFQYAGLSPNTAELAYAVTQLSPAAYEAFAANRSVNQWTAFNVYSRETYLNLAVSQADLDTLAANGVRFTSQNVVATGTTSEGAVVFLETGSQTAGLQHIIERHGDDFVSKGIAQSDIPAVVMEAVTRGTIVGTNGSAPVYQITYGGVSKYISVGVGSNGFIVRANPVSTWKPLK
ncbi:hypothetical protein C8J98_102458 [Luteibacter sp. OK325]|nr:hypothetical protein C8J98_102458 [Luteibacter sp. OK325]